MFSICRRLGAHDLPDMLEKLSAIFTCIRESGMKLATDKCAFGLKEIVLGEHDNFRGFDPHQTENRDVPQNNQDAEKC